MSKLYTIVSILTICFFVRFVEANAMLPDIFLRKHLNALFLNPQVASQTGSDSLKLAVLGSLSGSLDHRRTNDVLTESDIVAINKKCSVAESVDECKLLFSISTLRLYRKGKHAVFDENRTVPTLVLKAIGEESTILGVFHCNENHKCLTLGECRKECAALLDCKSIRSHELDTFFQVSLDILSDLSQVLLPLNLFPKPSNLEKIKSRLRRRIETVRGRVEVASWIRASCSGIAGSCGTACLQASSKCPLICPIRAKFRNSAIAPFLPSESPSSTPTASESRLPSPSSSATQTRIPSASSTPSTSIPFSTSFSATASVSKSLGAQNIQISTKPTVPPAPSSGLDQDVLEQPFDRLTFRTGQGRDDSGFLETADGSLIKGSYEFSIISEGVVALKFGKEIIDDLLCAEDGSISVKLKSTYRGTTGSVNEMYPIGSVVSVDADTFGACRFLDFGPVDNSVLTNADSGYLKVESVSGTPMEHTIFGQAVDFLDLFSFAEFNLEGISNILETSSRIGSSKEDQLAASERLTAKKTVERTLWETEKGDVKLKSKTELSVTSTVGTTNIVKSGETKVYKFSWSNKISLDGEIFFQLEDVNLVDIPQFESKNRVSIPVGPSVIVKLFTFSFRDGIEFETLKLGFFVEFPIVVRPQIVLKTSWKIPAIFSVSTGMRNLNAIVTISNNRITTNVNTLGSERASIGFSTPNIVDIFLPNLELVFSLFAGIQPSLNFYLPGVRCGIGFDIGLQADAKISNLQPFSPVQSGLVRFSNELCKICHQAQLDLDFVVGDIKFITKINRNIEEKPLLPMEIKETYKLLSFCFLNSSFETCGSSCCAPNAEICSTQNQCRLKALISSTPSTSISISSTPSASPSSSVSSSTTPTISSSTSFVPEGSTPTASSSTSPSESQQIFSVSSNPSPSSSASVSITTTPSPSSTSIEVNSFVIAACSARTFLQNGSGFSGSQPEKDHVKGLQILLNFKVGELSNSPIDEDGLFGSGTESAVILFQQQVSIDTDGLVGSQTWENLCLPPLPSE